MSKVTRDYMSVTWEDHFYLDKNSPSGLSRSKDVYTGKGYTQLKFKKGSPAGSMGYNRGTTPSGWDVRVAGVKYKVHRIIWVMANKHLEEDKVIDHVNGNPFDNSIENLVVKTIQSNSQNQAKRSNNTSGITGVSQTDIKGTSYWCSRWIDNSVRYSKAFSIAKLGYETAKKLAIEHRNLQITLLNAAGASYTKRHCGLTPCTSPVPSSVQPT